MKYEKQIEKLRVDVYEHSKFVGNTLHRPDRYSVTLNCAYLNLLLRRTESCSDSESLFPRERCFLCFL